MKYLIRMLIEIATAIYYSILRWNKQKQSFVGVIQNRCSSKSCKFRSKTKALEHRFFPVKFANFLRTPFLQNTCGGCFWTNPEDLCRSFGKGIFWSFSISLSWLSNIMLKLLTKSSLGIYFVVIQVEVRRHFTYIVDCE